MHTSKFFSFIAGVVDTANKHSFTIIFANFRKKFEMIIMVYLGVGGTLIYEKNLKSKISCQTPFKYFQAQKRLCKASEDKLLLSSILCTEMKTYCLEHFLNLCTVI